MRLVLLVTDTPVVVEGFRSLLAGSENILLEPVPFDTGRLRDHVLSAEPDIVVVDCNRDMSLAVLSGMCSSMPRIPTVLFARNTTPELVYHAQDAGFSCLLDSRCSREQILSTFQRCGYADFAFEGPQGLKLPAFKAVHMTPREGQMVCLLAEGLKNKEIAAYLGISEGTVKVYLSKLFRKVGAKDRFELALFGLKNFLGAPSSRQAPPAQAAKSVEPVSGLSTLVLSESYQAAMHNAVLSPAPGTSPRHSIRPIGRVATRPHWSTVASSAGAVTRP